MKKHFMFKNLLLGIIAVSFFFTSCKKEEEKDLTLSELMAGDIDLNGATAPTNVPVDPVITATFSTDVDPTTVTASNITLTQDYDDSSIPLTVSASGNTVTIDPQEALGSGTLYLLNLGSGLLSTDGKPLEALERSFTTEGTFAPSGVIAYWNFEDDADDQTGTFMPSDVIDIDYEASRNSAAGMAATFNGSTSLIRIPNGDDLSNTDDFALSFWVNADSTKHGQFVMGLSAWFGFQFEIAGDYSACKLAAQYDFGDGSSNSDDLWFPGNGETKDNGGWQGWTFCADLRDEGGVKALLADKWAHIVCMYNSSTKVGSMYINGELMKAQDFNLWPDDDPKQGIVGLKFAGNEGNNTFVFGFIQDYNDPTLSDDWANYSNPANNHFKGQLDDVRFFHKVLTETEIGLMYNSENQ